MLHNGDDNDDKRKDIWRPKKYQEDITIKL